MKYDFFKVEPYQPILPSCFSPEMSYLELINKINFEYEKTRKMMYEGFRRVACTINDINDDITKLKNMFLQHNDTMLALAKQYTDSIVNPLQNRVSNLDKNLNSKIDANVVALQKQINDNFITLTQRIADNYNYVQNQLDSIDGVLDRYLLLSKQYTDSKITVVNSSIDNLDKLVRSQLADFNGQIDNFKTYLDSFNSDYVAFKSDIKKYVDMQLQDAVDDLTKHVTQLNGDLILVTSPVTGKTETLKNALAQVYSGLWWAKITAKEYDNMHLNASQYDSRKITAIDYDTHARFIFFNELYMLPWWQALQDYQAEFLNAIQEINKQLTMRNPITGGISSMQQVIYDILDKLHNQYKLTANEYDHLKVMAGSYDALRLSAFEYDFFAKKHLGSNYISVRP